LLTLIFPKCLGILDTEGKIIIIIIIIIITRLSVVSGDARETSFLSQRLSIFDSAL